MCTSFQGFATKIIYETSREIKAKSKKDPTSFPMLIQRFCVGTTFTASAAQFIARDCSTPSSFGTAIGNELRRGRRKRGPYDGQMTIGGLLPSFKTPRTPTSSDSTIHNVRKMCLLYYSRVVVSVWVYERTIKIASPLSSLLFSATEHH